MRCTARCRAKKNQYGEVIPRQDEAENDEIYKRKQSIDAGADHKGLNTAVVADSLHDVANYFGVKETERKPHQLGKEVGNQSDIDTCVRME